MNTLLFGATIPERLRKATREWELVGFAESQEAYVAALKSLAWVIAFDGIRSEDTD